jgi:BirA family transcriptional regulator, biotin operon repressor / biotin---[acetyl-CoA-carboxylase] ligase
VSGGAEPTFGASARFGLPRVHVRRIGSTNDRARELALGGAPHGTLVTAAEQSAGRGRQGRRWSAPAGSSLLMSIVLREPPPTLPLLAAVAVCEVVGPRALVKWPNDVVVRRACAREERTAANAGPSPDAAPPPPSHAKLAGILVEGRPQQGWAVLGIGVNVAVRPEELPASVRDGAATLGRDREAIDPFLAELLAALERRLREPPAPALRAWRERDVLHGREIAWSSGRGRAAGIDESGRLLVDLHDGTQVALSAGEVHLESVGAER